MEYPRWHKARRTGKTVKFTAPKKGVVVVTGKQNAQPIGYHSENWVEHTDTVVWEQVEEPKVKHYKNL